MPMSELLDHDSPMGKVALAMAVEGEQRQMENMQAIAGICFRRFYDVDADVRALVHNTLVQYAGMRNIDINALKLN